MRDTGGAAMEPQGVPPSELVFGRAQLWVSQCLGQPWINLG